MQNKNIQESVAAAIAAAITWAIDKKLISKGSSSARSNRFVRDIADLLVNAKNDHESISAVSGLLRVCMEVLKRAGLNHESQAIVKVLESGALTKLTENRAIDSLIDEVAAGESPSDAIQRKTT